MRRPGTVLAFLASLAAGVIVGHHFDGPRVWRSRIVPSVRID